MKPDLKLLAVGIAVHLGLPRQDVDSLRTCSDSALALLMLRIIMRRAKAIGAMTSADEDRIIAAAIPRVDLVAAMAATVVSTNATVTGISTTRDVIMEVDRLLVSPKTRASFPSWFVTDFWPSLTRKLASGEAVTEREISIARHIITDVQEKA